MAKKKGVRQQWEEAAVSATKQETVKITLTLADFVKESWQVIEPSTDLLWNWHIDAMCWHIQETLLDWYRHKTNPHYVQRIQNLLINVPPGSLKSRCLSVCTPAWMWTICPSWRAIFLSANPRVALRDSVYCRDVIESDWYQKRFSPDWKLRIDNNSKSSFWNTKGGVRSAFGFNSRITGDRGDGLFWDDPHDAQEVLSDTIREGVIDRWDSAIRNRVNDLKSSVRVGIMQRLHTDDLAGHVLEQGGWGHLCIPQEFETKLSPTALGWVDPRTEPDELMFPERFSAVAIAPFVEAGNVFLPDPSIAAWVGDYVGEFSTFPNGSNDDQCDSTSQAINWLASKVTYWAVSPDNLWG